MAELTRRRLLAASSAGAIAAVAGCLGDDDDEPDGENGGNGENGDDDSDVGSEIEDATRGPLLGDVTLNNLDDQSHTVNVIVEIDGQNVAWEDETLDPGEGSVSLERSWPDDGGTFRVTVRVDGNELREVRPGDWNDPDCINLVILVGDGGALQVAGDTLGGPCEA